MVFSVMNLVNLERGRLESNPLLNLPTAPFPTAQFEDPFGPLPTALILQRRNTEISHAKVAH